MITNGRVTNKDLYGAITDLRKELHEEFSSRLEKVEERVNENTNWRNKVIGQFTIIATLIGVVVNGVWSILTERN